MKKKNKGGRPKAEPRKAKKYRVSIAIDEVDRQVLQNRIRKTGLKKSDYLRRAIFSGVIKTALTAEESYLIRQMYKVGQLLALLFTKGRLNKDVDSKVEFAKAIVAINAIYDYFLTQITKK